MHDELGRRVRAIRLASGLTIGELAERSGLSKSFISMLENGKTNISATRLQRLAAVFGLGAADFLPDEATRRLTHVIRRGEALPIRGLGDGVEGYLLTRQPQRRLQPVLLTLAPGACQDNPTGHAGEEFIYVISGQLLLSVGDEGPLRLEVGDAASYSSALSHRYENPGAVPTVLLTVGTPQSWYGG
jgi:transcriptional regulator with XRE-family HTH domain